MKTLPLPLTAHRHLAAAACAVFLAFVSVLRVRTFADRTGALAVLSIVVLAAGCDVTPTTVAVDEETTYATRKPVTIVTERGSTCTVLPQRNPEITTAECRIVAAPTSADESPSGDFIKILLKVIEGVITGEFLESLEPDATGIGAAVEGCANEAEAKGWGAHSVQVVFTNAGKLVKWDCVEP